MTTPPTIIQRGTTNYVNNPVAATNLTNIVAVTATTSRITDDGPLAYTTSVEVTVTNAGSMRGVQFVSLGSLGITGLRTFVPSVYLKSATGGTVIVYCRLVYTDATQAEILGPASTMTASWARYTGSPVTSDGVKTVNQVIIYVRTNPAQNLTFRASAAMVEQGTTPSAFTIGTRAIHQIPGFIVPGTPLGPLKVG